MTEHEASRTLVKSPPELWAECSEAASLARHLEQFGELRITRLEPETAVAWEGETACGTVRLEPSGWGTRVILTARASEAAALPAGPPEPESVLPEAAGPSGEDPPEPGDPPDPDPDPAPLPPAAAAPERVGFFARVRRWLRGPDPVDPEPEPDPAAVAPPQPEATPDPEPEPEPARDPPEPVPAPSDEVTGALTAALDSLGQAHHRPFSRA